VHAILPWVIAGMLLCQHANGAGRWIALAVLSGLFFVPGLYWLVRCRHLAERSERRGYRFRATMWSPLRPESPAIYVLGGLFFCGFGTLALVGSVLQRNPTC